MRSSILLVAAALSAAAASTAGSTPAHAGQTDEPKSEDGYGYEFGDDPLTAGGFGP